MLYYLISVFFSSFLLVCVFRRRSRPKLREMEKVFSETVDNFKIQAKLKLYGFSGGANCEIIISGVNVFKFKILFDENIIISGKPTRNATIVAPYDEIQTMKNFQLLLLLIFERHYQSLSCDLRQYRKSLYHWNVGTLNYTKIENRSK